MDQSTARLYDAKRPTGLPKFVHIKTSIPKHLQSDSICNGTGGRRNVCRPPGIVFFLFDCLRFVLWKPHFLRNSKLGRGTDEQIHFAKPDTIVMFFDCKSAPVGLVGLGELPAQVGVAGIDEQQEMESAAVPVVTPSWFDGATGVRFHRKF